MSHHPTDPSDLFHLQNYRKNLRQVRRINIRPQRRKLLAWQAISRFSDATNGH